MPVRLKSNRARGNPNKMFGHLTIDFSNKKMKWITLISNKNFDKIQVWILASWIIYHSLAVSQQL